MKFTAQIILLIILSGCSSNPVGINDGMFDQTFMLSINSSPTKDQILFKSYTMEHGDWGAITENFVITDNGIYITNWDRGIRKFIIKHNFEFEYLKNVHIVSEKKETMLGYHAGIIQITTKDNQIHTYSIHGNSVSFAHRIIVDKINQSG